MNMRVRFHLNMDIYSVALSKLVLLVHGGGGKIMPFKSVPYSLTVAHEKEPYKHGDTSSSQNLFWVIKVIVTVLLILI